MSTFGDASNLVDTKMIVGQSAQGTLLSVVNAAGLVLDGIVFSPPEPRLAIVHVHGSLGNFYQQPFNTSVRKSPSSAWDCRALI